MIDKIKESVLTKSKIKEEENEKETLKEKKNSENSKTKKDKERKFCNEAECEQSDKEKFKNCKYRKKTNEVDNNAAKLRTNLNTNTDKKDKDDFDEISTLKKEENGKKNSCRIAAHHIISGKQVFQDLSEIVKLTQGVGYDINCAENGIFLPTNESNFGYDKKKIITDNEKIFSAYRAMDELGRQWHAGKHSYKIPKDILNKNIELNEIKNYAETVRKKVQEKFKIERYKQTCRDKDEQKKKIIEKMNQISLEIKEKLRDFKQNPQNSYPYFVSKVAVEYAYSIPETIKVITLSAANDSVFCRKYRVENEKNSDHKFVKGIQGEGIRKFNFSEEIDRSKFGEYCGNVQHFFIYSSENEEIIKEYLLEDDFKIMLPENSRPEKEAEYLNENIVMLEGFVIENKFLNKRIRERKEQIKKVIQNKSQERKE
ncbi:MAG: AHH domain-containing protein [Fusobacteriaceae bacterium]